MILVINLNASVDKRYKMKDLIKGEVMRAAEVDNTPGSKGIHVANVATWGNPLLFGYYYRKWCSDRDFGARPYCYPRRAGSLYGQISGAFVQGYRGSSLWQYAQGTTWGFLWTAY